MEGNGGEYNQNTLCTYVSENSFDKNTTYQGKAWGLEKQQRNKGRSENNKTENIEELQEGVQ